MIRRIIRDVTMSLRAVESLWLQACLDREGLIMKPETISPSIGALPPSGLGPDGKILRLSDEEWRERRESARRRLVEIALIPDGPNDPPDEEWMRGIDELRPHRPVFKGCY